VNHEAKLKGVAKASDYTQNPGHSNLQSLILTVVISSFSGKQARSLSFPIANHQ